MPTIEHALRETGGEAVVSVTPHAGAIGFLSRQHGTAWAMEPAQAQAFIAAISGINVAALEAIQVADVKPLWRREGRTAIIDVKGVLLNSVPGWMRLFGYEATGYDELTAALGQVDRDDGTDAVRLDVESPGGMAHGNKEVADMIRQVRQRKRVEARIEDLGASAAYWLAAQADRITATPNALVGSIGVYTVYWDMTALAERIGIKVHLIRAGELKGMGVPGAPISDEQIAAMQENIDAIYEDFVAGVAAGRRRDKKEVTQWATGRVWEAKASLRLGLIDAIEARRQLNSDNLQEATMLDNQVTSAAAEADTVEASMVDVVAVEKQRVAELTEAFPGDSSFALEAINAGWSVLEAKSIRHDRLAAELKVRNEREAAAAADDGVDAVPFAAADGGGGGDFMEQVSALARAEKIGRTDAMKRVRRENPAAYEQFRTQESRRRPLVTGGRR